MSTTNIPRLGDVHAAVRALGGGGAFLDFPPVEFRRCFTTSRELRRLSRRFRVGESFAVGFPGGPFFLAKRVRGGWLVSPATLDDLWGVSLFRGTFADPRLTP